MVVSAQEDGTFTREITDWIIDQLPAGEWKPEKLDASYSEIGLEGLNERIELILRGKLKGRIIVNLLKA